MEDLIKLKSRNPGLLLSHSDYALSPEFKEDLERSFLKGIPFQYQLNQSEFYKHKFFVNKNVLIPRQETEYLVDLILSQTKKPLKILDVGVGSGVILLSLLSELLDAQGMGVDLSNEAIEVAKINAHRLGLLDRTKFLLSDRLTLVNDKFDLIVSNPPYIKEQTHLQGVHANVVRFEPHLALFLKDAEYEKWFEVFFTQVKNHLNPGGQFFMEGHELEVESQALMLERLGFCEVQVIADLTGAKRFISGQV